jgi:hypothetical protein
MVLLYDIVQVFHLSLPGPAPALPTSPVAVMATAMVAL